MQLNGTVNQAGTWSVVVTRPGCSDAATDSVDIVYKFFNNDNTSEY